MRIAILALQGAFAEHQQMLHRMGVETFLIRNLSDWQKPKDGLILPGGESTAMMKIMSDEGLLTPITEAIRGGLPVFGTCAGMILLDEAHLGCMDISVKRNAYGRQLGSFYVHHKITLPSSCGEDWEGEIPMTFIRAPYIERVGNGVSILSSLDSHIIAARQDNMLAVSFHPELNSDEHLHRYFVHSMVH